MTDEEYAHFQQTVIWTEIPTTDFERAKAFYEAIYGIEMFVVKLPQLTYGMLPGPREGRIGASIVHSQFHKPSTDRNGVLVYLNGGSDLNNVLNRVEAAGGKVLRPKMFISEEMGHIALFEDSEGNRVGLNSLG